MSYIWPKMPKHGSLFLLIVASYMIATSVADPWDSNNDPKHADSDGSFVYNLAKLPLSNSLTVQPWSDTYWPSCQRYIITRSGKAFRLVNSFSARAQSSRLKKIQKWKNGKNENLRKFQKNGESKLF